MKMKLLFFVFFLFIQPLAKANMAEPVDRGTFGSRPFTSQYVDVTSENLLITIDERFETAKFEITYHIRSSRDGIKIPLLFYATEYTGKDFRIFIDGKEVSVQDIPYDMDSLERNKFLDFDYFFEIDTLRQGNKTVWIQESPTVAFGVDLHDFRYFETDILKGDHVIQVYYTASQWIDGWDWINEHSFRYALSPANYWKSFGILDVTLNTVDWDQPVSTNLGKPLSGNVDSVAHWRFTGLPTEILTITYNPEVSAFARFLLFVKPLALGIILGLMWTILHVFLIKRYRRKNPQAKYSWIITAGSFLVPLLFLSGWMSMYDFIDFVIGPHASGEHGYYFFIIILYPFIVPVYWLTMWLWDRSLKKKYHETKSTPL